MNKKVLAYFLLVLLLIVGLYSILSLTGPSDEPDKPTQTTKTPVTAKTTKPKKKIPAFVEPVAEFKKRITKKRFGIYSTPASSPVPNERFTGWHTGVDVEYEDVDKNINVHAIAGGTVVYSGWVSGYGGVTLLSHKIKGVNRTVVYGHLDPASLLPVGTKVKSNQIIGHLGAGHSNETDGERKHLHFGVLSDNRIDFKGYVPEKSQLSGWLNPSSLY